MKKFLKDPINQINELQIIIFSNDGSEINENDNFFSSSLAGQSLTACQLEEGKSP